MIAARTCCFGITALAHGFLVGLEADNRVTAEELLVATDHVRM